MHGDPAQKWRESLVPFLSRNYTVVNKTIISLFPHLPSIRPARWRDSIEYDLERGETTVGEGKFSGGIK